MNKAVIYDLDDLLVYTGVLHCESYMKALRSYNIDFDEIEFYRCFTKEDMRIGEIIEKLNLPVTENDLRKEKRYIYEELIRENLMIAEGAGESLERLHGRYPLALATSSGRINTDLIMDLTGFKRYFDSIITSTESEYVKPDPTCFRMASEELGAQPEKCVVIEDANRGIIAAKELGMKTIWVPSHITMDEAAYPDVRLKSLKEVTPSLIDRL